MSVMMMTLPCRKDQSLVSVNSQNPQLNITLNFSEGETRKKDEDCRKHTMHHDRSCVCRLIRSATSCTLGCFISDFWMGKREYLIEIHRSKIRKIIIQKIQNQNEVNYRKQDNMMVNNCSRIEETGIPETKLKIKFNIKKIQTEDCS